MVRITTLEQFLDYFCGMSPHSLVLHFIEHREWVEQQLATINGYTYDTQQQYINEIEDLWLLLPDPPSDFITYNEPQ